jgi:uncharacterized membrane protein HdeD (DUF308 family)
MFAVLAAQWGLLLFRGIVSVLFGISALVWPGLTLVALVALFGAYALIDGGAALILAFSARGNPGFGTFLAEGIFGIAAGLVTFFYPAITAIALLGVIAAWAILTGVAAIATAILLRRELAGEWPLPVAGGLSLLLGILLLLQPMAGALAVVWLIGTYALLTGAVMIALAVRLRQFAHELRHGLRA